jgi:hypothetical protein
MVWKVLLGQQRGRRQNGDLLATGHGDKRGAQGHLGLAKTHIAADQAVHGAGADHVLYHAVDGGLLIGGLFKAKVVGKGLVVVGRVTESMSFSCGAAGVDVQQLGGRIAHLLGGAAFGFFPLAAAQFVQRGFIGADAGVTADQLQLADRHVQRGLVGVFQV